MNQISFQLRPLAPFRLDYTAWVLKRRPDNIWDRWDGETYQRVLVQRGKPVEVAVIQRGPVQKPVLQVTARGSQLGPGAKDRLASTLERMLGLTIDLSLFYRLASKDKRLKTLVGKFRGVKPPRYPAVFEALVNAITCQQFTLTAGIRLLSRLVGSLGVPFKGADGTTHAFPRPEDLADADVETLRQWGFSYQKARAITGLARRIVEGEVDLEGLDALDDDSVMERLREFHGIGRWTAEYALLRGLGRIHVFPGDDVGVRNKLQRWLAIDGKLDFEGVHQILSRWSPYGGLIYFHLLLEGLADSNHFKPAL